MNTEVYKITQNEDENKKIISRAAEIIKNGGLVAIPTETVYGLAGSALIKSSAEKIYSAKGRPADNPLIVHIAFPEDAERFAYTNELYYKLAERFMPGPLTVILTKKPIIPDSVTAGLDSVAIRCPSNEIAHELIRVSTHPIAAPSANRSGIPSPTLAEHVIQDMNGRIEMIIDGGECDIGLESTVIKLTKDGCKILRPGAVTAEMLSEVCSVVEISDAVVDPTAVAKSAPESPGMKYKHYAPNAEVILIDSDFETFVRFVNDNASSSAGVMCSEEDADKFSGVQILDIGSTAEDEGKRLFTLLRRADELGLKNVYAMLPPKNERYLAIYNRIIRAAGSKIIKPQQEQI